MKDNTFYLGETIKMEFMILIFEKNNASNISLHTFFFIFYC